MKKEILVLVMILSCITLANSVEANSYDNAYLEITLLNQDPDPGEQGEYLDLRWKVIKKGNDKMDNLQFHLNLDFPFFFDKIDSADKTVGSWTGYSDDEEYYILHYKVRVDDEALEDTYKLKLKIKHDDSGISMMREYEITVGDKTDPELVLGTLVTSPVELLADTNENQLQVTLENIGDENAETVKMDLELPEGFTPTYGYSNKANLGTVNADESGTAT
ncbi:MAG: hypothetical protein L6408_01500, partial [Nanoarchaeota archaeon]|nr:hypothetical protein [Nanoarchaeota archaeon]